MNYRAELQSFWNLMSLSETGRKALDNITTNKQIIFGINSIFVVSRRVIKDIYDPHDESNSNPVGLSYRPHFPYSLSTSQDKLTKLYSITLKYAPSVLIATEIFKKEFLHSRGFMFGAFYVFDHEIGHTYVYSSLLRLNQMFPLLFPPNPNILMRQYDQEPYADNFALKVIFELHIYFLKILSNFGF